MPRRGRPRRGGCRRRAFRVPVGATGARRTSALRSRAAVARIYQEGFSDELADHLAELSWSEPQRGVRAGGFALEPPSPIVLLDVGSDEATVAFPTPIAQQLLWEEKGYTTATLSRREGRWVIIKSVTSEARPPALGPP